MIDVRKKNDMILYDKNIYKSIIILALPIFLSNFLKSFHSFVDLFFVSPIGDSAIASITVTSPIMSIAYALGSGFMIAGIAIMSQSVGARNLNKARKTASQLLIVSLIAALVITVGLYFLTPTVVRMVGAEGDTYTYAVSYVQTRSFELVPVFLFYTFLATRQASGDTVTPVIFDITGIILNILLSWLFIDVYNMGVFGAALGTVIGNSLIVPVFLFLLFRKNDNEIKIDLKKLRFSSYEVKKIFRIGTPAAISQAFTSLGFLIINMYVLSYGDATISGFGIGNNINSFVLMPVMGISGSLTIFVGHNIGAGNEKRARDSVRCAMIIAQIIMIICACILLPLRSLLASIFLVKGSPSFNVATKYMIFLFAGLPLMGFFLMFMGAYQGAGYTKLSLILATLRLWGIRIPLILIFKNVLSVGSTSIMAAMVISNALAVVVGYFLYKRIHFDRIIDNEMEEI